MHNKLIINYKNLIKVYLLDKCIKLANSNYLETEPLILTHQYTYPCKK
jgi:hypothetical protein